MMVLWAAAKFDFGGRCDILSTFSQLLLKYAERYYCLLVWEKVLRLKILQNMANRPMR